MGRHPRVSFGRWARGALPLLIAGCQQPPAARELSPTAPSASSVPLDRLAPGELELGRETAFGLPLPKLLKVERRFDDAVHASGPVAAEELANFIRERVAVAGVEIGAAKTVFPRATVKGGDGKILAIEVVHGPGGRSQLSVRDVSPPARPPGASAAELWRRAGLTEDGKSVAPDRNQ